MLTVATHGGRNDAPLLLLKAIAARRDMAPPRAGAAAASAHYGCFAAVRAYRAAAGLWRASRGVDADDDFAPLIMYDFANFSMIQT